jgi:hypothetical protein
LIRKALVDLIRNEVVDECTTTVDDRNPIGLISTALLILRTKIAILSRAALKSERGLH